MPPCAYAGSSGKFMLTLVGATDCNGISGITAAAGAAAGISGAVNAGAVAGVAGPARRGCLAVVAAAGVTITAAEPAAGAGKFDTPVPGAAPR